MAIKEGLRPGGRSARVQESIHSAVRALLQEQERSTVTVPQIAARAGVTPSTIYRRWGDLSQLPFQCSEADGFEQAIVHACLCAAQFFFGLSVGGKAQHHARRKLFTLFILADRAA